MKHAKFSKLHNDKPTYSLAMRSKQYYRSMTFTKPPPMMH
ncbi:2263_t:CDS:1, partial [Gigaspora rosea]